MEGMILLFLGLFLFTASAKDCDLDGVEIPNKDVANTLCLFRSPLVVGASVSAGFGTSTGGPATILARNLNPSSRVTNRSISGATSLAATSISPAERPSIVLGFDMFFWDAVRSDCGEAFESRTRDFFRRYRVQKIPMVIGKIPVGVPFPTGVRLASGAVCTRPINRLIDELCTPEHNCVTYDPGDCIRAMGSSVSPEGKPYFRDALHPTTEGNRFCAEHFARHARYKALDCHSN